MMYIELSSSQLQVLRLLAFKQRPLGYWQMVAYLEPAKPLTQHLAFVLEQLQGYALIEYHPQIGYRYGVYQINQAGHQYLHIEYGDPLPDET